jgi:hypothetical protein
VIAGALHNGCNSENKLALSAAFSITSDAIFEKEADDAVVKLNNANTSGVGGSARSARRLAGQDSERVRRRRATSESTDGSSSAAEIGADTIHAPVGDN